MSESLGSTTQRVAELEKAAQDARFNVERVAHWLLDRDGYTKKQAAAMLREAVAKLPAIPGMPR